MKWELIETAPKNGTPILAVCPSSGGHRFICIAHWFYSRNNPEGTFWQLRGGPGVYQGRVDTWSKERQPTHWMLLPKLPQ